MAKIIGPKKTNRYQEVDVHRVKEVRHEQVIPLDDDKNFSDF